VALKGGTRGVTFFSGVIMLVYRLTENDHICQDSTVGMGVFLGVSHAIPNGSGPQHPETFRDLYLRSYRLT